MSDCKFFTPIQIRYADFDMLGHINNATYVTYFEVARLYYFMEIGWTLEDVSSVIAHFDIDYLLPIMPGDKIICGIRTSSLGSKSFQMHYELWSADKQKCYAKANSTQVCFDKHTGKSAHIPDHIRELIANYDAL